MTETPQQIPIIINNGINRKKSSDQNTRSSMERKEYRIQLSSASQTRSDEKILLLGDSIINGINTKDLVKSVHKNSKGGATLQHLIDEVAVYDLKVFSTVILYISRNDAAHGKSPEWMEDKFDESDQM